MFAVSTVLRLQDASLIASTGPGMRSGRHRLRARQRASSSWRSALHKLFLNFAQAWADIYSFLATVPFNGHQKSFVFSETTTCLCGHAVESAKQYLFECSRFSQEGLSTLVVTLDSLPSIISWPPPFSSFFLHAPLWNALVSFVAKTKHLNLSLAGH